MSRVIINDNGRVRGLFAWEAHRTAATGKGEAARGRGRMRERERPRAVIDARHQLVKPPRAPDCL